SDETFTISLSDPTNASLGTPSVAPATIENDDARPTVSVSDVTVNEGNGGTTTATFTLALSGASAFPVALDYATADGTAAAGEDYTAAAGTVTFAAGERGKTVSVVVNGDATFEPDEPFFLKRSGAAAAIP